MRLEMKLSIGRCEKSDIIEIDDEEAADVAKMSEEQKQAWIGDYLRDFINNNIEACGEIIE